MSIRLLRGLVAAFPLVLLAGCTAPTPIATDPPVDEPPVAAPGFSIEALLLETPDLGETAVLSVADVAAAAEHAELPRPDEFGDDFAGWVHELSGSRAENVVSVPWPRSLGIQMLQRHDEFIAAAGFGLPDIDAFLEVSAPPQSFTILDGEFDTDAITAAFGEPTDGVWALEGEELVPTLDDPNGIDNLGRPVRVAGDAARLVLTLERELAEAWLEGSTEAPEGLLAAGRALDSEGVYAAQFLAHGDGYVGIGLAFRDGASVPIGVRVGGTPPQVGATDGRFTVGDVESDGGVHVVRYTVEEGAPPARVWQFFAVAGPLLGSAD